MGDNMTVAAKFEETLKGGDFGRLADLLSELAAEDFVQEWPQSGERLSKAAAARLAAGYPEMSGTNPTFTYRRMLDAGDIFVIEGSIDYGDGVPVSYVGIGEVRDRKVARMTEYFATPFEVPAWRAGFADRGDTAPM